MAERGFVNLRPAVVGQFQSGTGDSHQVSTGGSNTFHNAVARNPATVPLRPFAYADRSTDMGSIREARRAGK